MKMGRAKRTSKSSSSVATRRGGNGKQSSKKTVFSVDDLIEQGNLALNKLQVGIVHRPEILLTKLFLTCFIYTKTL
jgi:hypothetical protein